MGDELEVNYALSDPESDDDNASEGSEDEGDTAVDAGKRKREEEDESARKAKKKQKLKELKKKNTAKKHQNEELPPVFQQPAWMWQGYAKALAEMGVSLSDLEIDDRKKVLTEKRFKPLPTELEGRGAKAMCAHVKALYPGWKKRLTSRKGVVVGCPRVLVVTYSAIKAVDIVRSLKGLNVPVTKLFARHLKVKEQVELLKGPCAVAVGTPGRLLKLFEEGALTLQHTDLIILDSELDQKKRTMFTMPDIRKDLFALLHKTDSLAQPRVHFCLYQ